MNDEMIDIIAGITGVLKLLLVDVSKGIYVVWNLERNNEAPAAQAPAPAVASRHSREKHGNGVYKRSKLQSQVYITYLFLGDGRVVP